MEYQFFFKDLFYTRQSDIRNSLHYLLITDSIFFFFLQNLYNHNTFEKKVTEKNIFLKKVLAKLKKVLYNSIRVKEHNLKLRAIAKR